MKMFIVIVCIVIVMTVMAASILFDSVEVKEEPNTDEGTVKTVPKEQAESFEPHTVNDTIYMPDIDAKINWAKQRAKAHSQTPSNNTDEDSRQSRIGGRDYPRYYKDVER